jgi:hypothetical protein
MEQHKTQVLSKRTSRFLQLSFGEKDHLQPRARGWYKGTAKDKNSGGQILTPAFVGKK